MSQDFEREFQALIAAFTAEGGEGAEILPFPSNRLAGGRADWPPVRQSVRRTRRRDPLPHVHTFQLRLDLLGSTPPIWRRFEVRSDLTLDRLHLAIQGGFDWADVHLYRFALGNPFAYDSELFLCDYDVDEGEDEGLPASDVRLDETLQVAGDRLDYVYDYGDHWGLAIKLEAILGWSGEAPDAVCTGGRRAAPPEDCGSLRDAESLAQILPDPAAFNPAIATLRMGDFLDTTLNDPFGVPDWEEMPQWQRHPAFRVILQNTQHPIFRGELLRRLRVLDQVHEGLESRLQATDRGSAVSATTEFLQLLGDGVKLTKAGYLPPATAHAFARGLLADNDHWHIRGSEMHQRQPLEFRQYLQKIGLVRKARGVLAPTKAGIAAATDPTRLWQHLVDRIAPMPPNEPGRREFVAEAALLTLLFAATEDGTRLPIDVIADHLTEAGWQAGGGSPISYFNVAWNGANPAVLLWFMGPRAGRGWESPLDPTAVLLAQDALLRLASAASA